MKLLYITSLIQSIRRKDFPARFLLEDLLFMPNELLDSIMSNDEEKFFKLLPTQTKKDLNQVYLFRQRSYTPSEDEIMVSSAKSIFEVALENGNEKIVSALIESGKINLQWQNKDNVAQLSLLFRHNTLSLDTVDKAIDCLIKQDKNVATMKVKVYKHEQTLLELLAWNTVVFSNDENEYQKQQIQEIKIAQKLVEKGVDINHVGQIQRGNVLNIAALNLKPMLVDYFLSIDVEKRDIFDNLASYSPRQKYDLNLMGQVLSQGFLANHVSPKMILPIIESLHNAGVEFQDITDIHQDDTGYIEAYMEKVKEFVSLLDEKKLLSKIVPNQTDSIPMLATQKVKPKIKV